MSILEQLFGTKKQTSNYSLGGSGLRQGQRFDYMQNQIVSRVLPSLPLMEQTTGPGLGSFVEPLENKEPDTLSYDQVSKLNESEMQKLGDMENQYEALITQLVSLNSTSSTSGSYDKSKGKSAGVAAANIKKQLADLNKKITVSMNKLIKQTEKTNTINQTATGDAGQHTVQLRAQLNNLLAKKSAMDTLLAKRQTLTGQLADRRRELDASYLHYIAWFISAVTLGAIAFNQVTKK